MAFTGATASAKEELLKSLKEAEKITIENLPQATQFRKWKTQFRRDVANASTRPKEALQWIIAIESKSFDELEDPEGFDTLDFKLATALSKKNAQPTCQRNSTS